MLCDRRGRGRHTPWEQTEPWSGQEGRCDAAGQWPRQVHQSYELLGGREVSAPVLRALACRRGSSSPGGLQIPARLVGRDGGPAGANPLSFLAAEALNIQTETLP